MPTRSCAIKISFLFLFVFSFTSSFAQIDSQKLEQFRHKIDKKAKTQTAYLDSVTRAQDSLYREAVHVGKPAPPAQKIEVRKTRSAAWWLIAVSAGLTVVAVLIARKRKKRPRRS